MEIITKGCIDCPFCICDYDPDANIYEPYLYMCGLKIYQERDVITRREFMKQNKKERPITPDWCPLKQEPVTVKLTDNA